MIGPDSRVNFAPCLSMGAAIGSDMPLDASFHPLRLDPYAFLSRIQRR